MPGVGVTVPKRRKTKEGTISEADQRKLSYDDMFKLLGSDLVSSVKPSTSDKLSN